MPIKKYLRRIERMHDLIRKRATGNPEEFAERLDFNRSTLYKYLAAMKELGAPIAYDQFSETYYYTEEVEFLPFFSKKSAEVPVGQVMEIFTGEFQLTGR